MKHSYYALVLLAFASAHANILDEELDVRLTSSQEQQISDEEIAAFEQELARLAQEAEAVNEAEQPKEATVVLEQPEEVVILEEEQPKKLAVLEEQPNKEAVREAELQALLENLEEEQDQDN